MQILIASSNSPVHVEFGPANKSAMGWLLLRMSEFSLVVVVVFAIAFAFALLLVLAAVICDCERHDDAIQLES